jgi:hypothetical protein
VVARRLGRQSVLTFASPPDTPRIELENRELTWPKSSEHLSSLKFVAGHLSAFRPPPRRGAEVVATGAAEASSTPLSGVCESVGTVCRQDPRGDGEHPEGPDDAVFRRLQQEEPEAIPQGWGGPLPAEVMRWLPQIESASYSRRHVSRRTGWSWRANAGVCRSAILYSGKSAEENN